MKKPPVIKIDRAVGQTAFLLGDVCACRHDVSNVTLTLERCKDNVEMVFKPLSVDEYGYVVFDWCGQLDCLDDGFYIGTFAYRCQPCAQVYIQVGGDDCQVNGVVHIPKVVCEDTGGENVVAPIEMYQPNYVIERGV